MILLIGLQIIMKSFPHAYISIDTSVGNIKESTVQLSAASSRIKYMTNCFKEVLNLKDSTPDRNPPILDFITITGTIPGFVSLRNSETGNALIGTQVYYMPVTIQ